MINILHLPLLLCLLSLHVFSFSAEYPDKPIRFIVPYAAGGGTDLVARFVAQKLSNITSQQVLVDNRPGASSNIGTELVAKSLGDGYTILVTAPNFSTSEALSQKLGWKTEDFSPVIQFTKHSNVLVASSSSQIGNFKQFTERTKSGQPVLSFGSPGTASAAHLVIELLKMKVGIPLEHIGYKGSTPLKTDLMGGHILLGADGLSGQMEAIKSGKVIALAILGPKRSPFSPEIPSLGDYGINDIDGTGWYGALVPVSTPQITISKLHNWFSTILKEQEVKDKLAMIGVEPGGGSSDQFKAYLLSEREKWGAVIKAANIKMEGS
jgi:tripartite-type tricarboxylate transporter receptor subunit TctC